MKKRASWNKAKLKQNGNRQINNIIKSKQISFKVTCAWDCFTTCKVIFIMYIYIYIYIEMCFNNKDKCRTLHGRCC